jgi:hypothetical protein
VEDLATLDQGLDWVSDDLGGEDVVTVDRGRVELPIDAEVVRLETVAGVPPGFEDTRIPSRSIHYVIRLANGQTVIVGSTSVQDDETFVPMMELLIATLKLG